MTVLSAPKRKAPKRGLHSNKEEGGATRPQALSKYAGSMDHRQAVRGYVEYIRDHRHSERGMVGRGRTTRDCAHRLRE